MKLVSTLCPCKGAQILLDPTVEQFMIHDVVRNKKASASYQRRLTAEYETTEAEERLSLMRR